MSKIKNLLEEILYEKNNDKSLKIIYNVDVLIQDFRNDKEKIQQEPVKDEEPPEEQPQEQPEVQPEEQPQESSNIIDKILNEDIYKSKANGIITVSKEDAENIQTIDDLLDFLTKKTDEGVPVISGVVSEMVLNLIQPNANVSDIISKGDKIIIDINYGNDIDDSIGIKVNKLAGSDSVTVTMKKDNKILPSPFNLAEFNKQIIFYRNSVVS